MGRDRDQSAFEPVSKLAAFALVTDKGLATAGNWSEVRPLPLAGRIHVADDQSSSVRATVLTLYAIGHPRPRFDEDIGIAAAFRRAIAIPIRQRCNPMLSWPRRSGDDPDRAMRTKQRGVGRHIDGQSPDHERAAIDREPGLRKHAAGKGMCLAGADLLIAIAVERADEPAGNLRSRGQLKL